MTRLEFIETMKVLMPRTKFDETRYAIPFHNVSVYYDTTNIKVKGKIPYAVAKAIFAKYPCEKYDIKAGRIGLSSDPTHFLTDNIYEYEVNKKVKDESIDSRAERLHTERARLDARPNNGKYLDTYRIGTKEGLIAVLKELDYYYATKDKKNAKDPEKTIPKALEKANLHIIQSINPCITGGSWMMEGINASSYYQGWCRTNSTLALQELRRALDEFDRSVNPFMESDMPMEEILEDLKKLRVSIDYFDYEAKEEIQYYSISLDEEETSDYVRFGINPAGFSYTGIFHLDEKTTLYATHFYSYDKKEENQGEILLIEYFNKDDISAKKSIRYNVTKGTIGDKDKPKRPATELEVASLYLDLIKATKLAADITVNNLSRNRVQK